MKVMKQEEDHRQFLLQARRLWQQDNPTAAYSLYEKLLQEYPCDPIVLREYGRALYAEFNDFEKATSLFERALKKEPNSLLTLQYLADLYAMGYGQGYDVALSIYQQIIVLARNDLDTRSSAYIGMGCLYRIIGTYNDVIAAFRKATEIAPDRPDAHHNLGVALYEAGDLEGAQKELKIAEELLKERGESTIFLEKILKHLESKEKFHSGNYQNFSIIYEWPEGELE